MKDDKVIGFPNMSQVPTVGQRLCPFLSQAIVQAGHPGTIQVSCAGAACRLWEWCSGGVIERLCQSIDKYLLPPTSENS